MSEIAYVSSAKLIDLQSQLNQLANNLDECYQLLCEDVKQLGESWQDEKYEEFDVEFKDTREKIAEIAEKYRQWANTHLPPRIELAQQMEGQRVGL